MSIEMKGEEQVYSGNILTGATNAEAIQDASSHCPSIR